MKRDGHDADRVQLEQGFGTSTASLLYMPWQTLQALATETGQAVRQTFTDSGFSTTGHVQQGVQTHASPLYHRRQDQSREPQVLLDSGQVSVTPWHITDAPVSATDVQDAVHAETKRVERKMLSTDAATEVILRFNFLSGRESRVSFLSGFAGDRCLQTPLREVSGVQAALLCIVVSILMGGAVLITEFVKKMSVVCRQSSFCLFCSLPVHVLRDMGEAHAQC